MAGGIAFIVTAQEDMKGKELMTSRRGRPRSEDQRQDRLRQVIALFHQEHTTLEGCQAFDECSGVRRVHATVMQRLPRTVYKKGTTLDLLIQGASLDVMGDLYAAERPRDEKLAQFIQAYFFECRTLVDITTNVLGLCDRSNVRNTYQVEAFTLVARQFLTLVDHDDPLTCSSGVADALEQQERRWDRASHRVSAALQQLHEHRYGIRTAYTLPRLPSDACNDIKLPSDSSRSANGEHYH